jgi:hypothetical protein
MVHRCRALKGVCVALQEELTDLARKEPLTMPN